MASRGAHRFNKGFLVAAVIIVAVILYGSLYPFAFYQPEGGAGPLRNLVRIWAETPGRGEFVANAFFYLPLSLFGSLAFAGGGRTLRRILLVTLAAGVLSTLLLAASWAETCLPGRSAEITDALMALLIGTIIAVVKFPTESSRNGPV